MTCQSAITGTVQHAWKSAPLAPAVSIITPYYNTGPLFEETIRAVLSQTLTQWEWIIINDGSTDPAALATLDLLRHGQDARICVIDASHRGLPGARNIGVAASSASLVFFLDSDDRIAPTALEKMLGLLRNDQSAAMVTSWSTGFGVLSYEWPRGFEVGTRFLYENTLTPMVMMRRAVFEAVGGFDETRIYGLEDYELWLRCAAQGYWGRDIPEFLVHLRCKSPEQYPGYSWPSRDDPHRYRAFLREMRARYPALFRQGLPDLPTIDSQAAGDFPMASRLMIRWRRQGAWRLAYSRLAVWAYPAYRLLCGPRLRPLRHLIKRMHNLLQWSANRKQSHTKNPTDSSRAAYKHDSR